MKRDPSETVGAIAHEGPGDPVGHPAVRRAVGDVVVKVPLPRVGQENEAMSGVAKPRLREASHRAAHEVSRNDRVAVVQDAGHRARLLGDRLGERRIVAIERVPGRVVDRQRA